MKKVLLALLLCAGARAQEPDQPPMVDLTIPAGASVRGLSLEGVDIRGSGDGVAHHFVYVVKTGPGVLMLQLQAKARLGATAVKVRLQDDQGVDLSQLEALAGSTDAVLEIGQCQVDVARTLHLHMNIDPNTGPYTLTVTGPLTR